MCQRVLWGASLLAACCVTSVLSAGTVTGVTVSGGSLALSTDLLGDPAEITVLTLSDTPTELSFTRGAGETPFAFTLTQFNSTGEAWEGFHFSISGGAFTATPRWAKTGLGGSLFGVGDTQAQLLGTVGLGGLEPVDLDVVFGSGTTGVLTVTPIVPEPGAGLLLGAAAFTMLRRGGRRGRD